MKVPFKDMTTERFISLSKEVHPGKFTYENTIYINTGNKVKLNCVIHGEFEQKPRQNIIVEQGCKKCVADSLRWTKEKFVMEASAVHNNFYDYSETNYNGYNIKTDAKCPLHGKFEIYPNNHIGKAHRCPACAGVYRMSLEEFLLKIKEKWGSKCDYSLLNEFKGMEYSFEVICKQHPDHGKFTTDGIHHYHRDQG